MAFGSAGCQTCRDRRIKCDGAQPICERCTKSCRTCTGMRSPHSVVHIENAYASGKRKRPRGPRSKHATTTTDVEANPEAFTSRSDAVVPRSLFEPLKTRAVGYYMSRYLEVRNETPDLLKSVTDDFLPLWSSQACPMLDYGLSCMALTIFSRIQRHPPAAIEATANYQQLLHAAQEAIPLVNGKTFDICLAAIFFMGRHEASIHWPSSVNRKTAFVSACGSFTHHDGALALLKAWKDQFSHSLRPTSTIKHTRRGLLRSALLRRLPVPKWLSDGACFGEDGMELDFDRILVRIVNLRFLLYAMGRRNASSCCSSAKPFAMGQQLHDEAVDIDRALDDWTTRLPNTWHPRQHSISASTGPQKSFFYGDFVYSWPSLAHGAVWCRHYAYKMLVNSVRLHILGFIRSSLRDYERCLATLDAGAHDLAATIPFCLHDFTVEKDTSRGCESEILSLNADNETTSSMADLLFWPFTIAAGLTNLPSKQRLWFRLQLGRIGRLAGVGVLEHTAAEGFEF